MGDRILAGYGTVGTFTPIQLYAGEGGHNGHTTQGTVAAGQVLGQLNARGETYLFPVVSLVGGKLVKWDPLNSDNAADFASGTVTFSVAVPTAGETVTINGKAIEFVAAADPDEDEVTIGATLTATATNLAAFVNAHRNDFGIAGGVTATSAAGVVTVRSPGTAGNAVTLAEAGANIAVSGGTLAGGDDDDADVSGAALPYGILPHALDTSATGYNADTDSPVLIGGDYNYEALDVPAGTTYAELKRAFARTPINIQKLY